MARSPPQAPYKRAAGEENFANYMLIYTILHDFSRSDSAPRSARSDQKLAAAAAAAAATAAVLLLLLLLLLLRHRLCRRRCPCHLLPRPTAAVRARPSPCRHCRRCRRPAAPAAQPPAVRTSCRPAAAWQQPSRGGSTVWLSARSCMPQRKSLRTPHARGRPLSEGRQYEKKQQIGKAPAEARPKLRARLIAHSERRRALLLPPPSSRRTRRASRRWPWWARGRLPSSSCGWRPWPSS